jgi:hypothetical protein
MCPPQADGNAPGKPDVAAKVSPHRSGRAARGLVFGLGGLDVVRGGYHKTWWTSPGKVVLAGTTELAPWISE